MYSQVRPKSSPGRGRGSGGSLECTDLCRGERAVRADWEVIQNKRAKTHTHELLHPMANGFAHASYLAVAAFVYGDLQPGLLLARA